MLTFGTVMASVKIIKGTETPDKAVSLNLMHKGDCKGAVGKPTVCKECKETLTPDKVGRAVNGVEVNDEILDSFKVKSDQQIEVTALVPFSEIDARLFDEPRFIVPDKGAETAVRAIRDGLARLKKPHAGIGKIAKEDKEVIVAVYVKDNALVIHDLRWPETLRDTQPYAGTIDAGKVVTEKLTKGVDTMLGDMIAHFDAAQYVDEKSKVREDVLRQIASGTKVQPQSASAAPQVDDLAAQIEAAVAAAAARRVA